MSAWLRNRVSIRVIGPAGTSVLVGTAVIVRVAVGGRVGVRVGTLVGDEVAVCVAFRVGEGAARLASTVTALRVDVATRWTNVAVADGEGLGARSGAREHPTA